ncbi:MAG: hypothetical protein HRU17_23970 [Polyangiaceae bacterium]|nr:hypothetical protein [Polyangiaceae bacterium]
MSVEIREIQIGGKIADFINVVDYIYRDDPAYIRPLDMDLKMRLSPKNPFFEHAEGTLFTAYRNGWCVGRCSAQICQEHLSLHKDDTGFFGFLDTVDDPEVSGALLDSAREWLRDRGMKRVRGPMSLSMNDELGCQIEGFEHSPMLMMPHHRPYQSQLIEDAGFEKTKDLFAWRYGFDELPKRVKRAIDKIDDMPEVSVRPMDPKNIKQEVRLIMEIFNDAWSENWAFVPLTESELNQMADDLKLILVPEFTAIATIDGKPAAVALALPNLNELIHDADGKLFPTGLVKLLWRLKVVGAKSARMLILGVRKEYQKTRKYAALSAYLYGTLSKSGKCYGLESGELGWTLEDNGAINAAIRMIGGEVYKKYRVYERDA